MGSIMSGQHGFARVLKWDVISDSRTETSCTFSLKYDANTLKLWPHKFILFYTVTLCPEGLHVRFRVKNCDETDFQITSLLHTYFNVGSIDSVEIEGLRSLQFADKLKNIEISIEDRGIINNINEEVDRNYFNVPNIIIMNCLTGKFEIQSDFKDLGMNKHLICNCSN